MDCTGKPLWEPPRGIPCSNVELLKEGSWSLLSPELRDYANASIQIPLPKFHIPWPPKNWSKIDRQQHTSHFKWWLPWLPSMMTSQRTSQFRDKNYWWRTLTCWHCTADKKDTMDNPMAMAQRHVHSALMYSLSQQNSKTHCGLVAYSDKTRNSLLRQVNLCNVPVVFYLYKGQWLEPDPAYSPTRPGLGEWNNLKEVL